MPASHLIPLTVLATLGFQALGVWLYLWWAKPPLLTETARLDQIRT